MTYLYFWEDISVQAIASTLEIPKTLVFKIIESALVRLRPGLEGLLEDSSIEISNLEAAA
ncbi:MAG: hypothetical protein K2X47_04595 [Bdellovibrionales bacterium]|nr:hypothetical protein [Bdellovibrionales bacterium]